jgi:hypothetical protein
MLNLNNTKISDAGLEHLEALPALRDLHVAKTKVTEAGMERLQQNFAGRLRIYTIDLSLQTGLEGKSQMVTPTP